MTDVTVGEMLNTSFDRMATAFDELLQRVDDLELRVQELEAGATPAPPPEVPEPTPDPDPVIEIPEPDYPTLRPQIVRDTENPAELQSGTRLHVRAGLSVGSLNLSNLNDVELIVDGRVDSIWMANTERVAVSGSGRVGSISCSEWTNGRPGHRNADVSVEDITVDGQGSAFDVQFVRGVFISNVRTENTTRYCIWMSNCQNAAIRDCIFHTTGAEACVRLVTVESVAVLDNQLSSDLKHTFRIHGRTNNVMFERNESAGPRFSMIGTMPGDELRNIVMRDNEINGATVQLLGVPINEPNKLQNFTWQRNFVSDDSANYLASYQGVPTWTIDDD